MFCIAYIDNGKRTKFATVNSFELTDSLLSFSNNGTMKTIRLSRPMSAGELAKTCCNNGLWDFTLVDEENVSNVTENNNVTAGMSKEEKSIFDGAIMYFNELHQEDRDKVYKLFSTAARALENKDYEALKKIGTSSVLGMFNQSCYGNPDGMNTPALHSSINEASDVTKELSSQQKSILDSEWAPVAFCVARKIVPIGWNYMRNGFMNSLSKAKTSLAGDVLD